MITYFIIGKNIDLRKYHFIEPSIKVGIDKGAFFAIEAGLKLDDSIGDFDSVNEDEFKLIEKNSHSITKLNPIKDETDTFYAYKKYKDTSDSIVILGGIEGKRVEHLLAVLNILKSDKKVSLYDDFSYITTLNPDEEYHYKKGEYKYFSFYSLGTSVITLKGFDYPLNKYVLNELDSLCISNELKEEEGTVLFAGDRILSICSKKD